MTGRQPPLQQVLPRSDESFHVVEFKGDAIGCSWHVHSEYQLSVVIKGEGQRIVGDAVCPIEAGEVTLLGSNLPHVWRYNSTIREVEAVVVHFSEDFAGVDFLSRPEMRSIRFLLARANHGLQAHGETCDLVASLLRDLPCKSGFDRVLDLLTALNALAASQHLTTISSLGYNVRGNLDLERLRCVYAFLDDHLHEQISRDQVATVAHLSPTAFSRFFHQHTGRTFQEHLNERRIGRSCELLVDMSRSITDVAMDCGFSSPTSFTRAFRRVKKTTPSAYREKIAAVMR